MKTEREIILQLQKELKLFQNKTKETLDIKEQLERQIIHEDQLWKTAEGANRLHAEKNPSVLHTKEKLANILCNNQKLRIATPFECDQFDWIYDRFETESKKVEGPLFAEDDKPDSGNRCLLTRKEVLLLVLMYFKSGATQEHLSIIFEIDQSTVCRYIHFSMPILAGILPTAEKIQHMIKNTKSKKEFEKFIPKGVVVFDGTLIPLCRPEDWDTQKLAYNGKNKAFGINFVIAVNKDGLVVATSPPQYGAAHDMNIAKNHIFDLGASWRSVFDPDTPEKERMTIYADKGFIGLEKIYPGANMIIPEKKKKGQQLTKRQKLENRKKGSQRIVVEHSFARFKQNRILTKPHSGSLGYFENMLKVASGIANSSLLWDKKKKQPTLDF